MDNKRVVPFPEAGEEVVLFLRNRDLREFEKIAGKDYLFAADQKLEKLDPEFVGACLKIMVKHVSNYEPYEIPEGVLDNIPLDTLRTRLLDAISFTVAGKPYQEVVIETLKKITELQSQVTGEGGEKAEDPLPASPTLS